MVAEKALEGANFNILKGKEMRVMRQQLRFKQTCNPKGNLFVKNLPDLMTNKELLDKFSAYGNILSCKVAFDKETGKSLHYGYVHFSDPNVTQKVLADMNKDVVEEGAMYVMEYEKRMKDTSSDWVTCYVANFPTTLTEDGLRDLFGKYGTINSVYIGYKRYNPQKIQGFVTFANHDSAVKAVEGLKDQVISVEGAQPMVMYVNRLQSREERASINQKILEEKKKEEVERTKGRFLYVGFGDQAITLERLREIFQAYGNIESCSIARDKNTKELKPFGFVCMDTTENAQNAIRAFHESHDLKLKVELAQTREERAKMLKERRKQTQGVVMQYPVVQYTMPIGMNMGNRMPSNKQQQQQQIPMMPMMYQTMGNMMSFPRNTQMPGMPMQMMNQGYMSMANTQVNEKYNKLATLMQSMEPIKRENIDAMTNEERRNTFGERIFYLIKAIGDPRCSKITGMMLELPVDDLMKIISDPGELLKKIDEANDVLDQTSNN